MHAATRCPTLDESFPFMLPGWQAEKTPGTLQDGSVHVKIKRSGHWLARDSRQVGLCLMTTLGRRAGGGGGGVAPFRCCRGDPSG